VAAHRRAWEEAIDGVTPGVERLRALGRASVRWAVNNPALAQLLYWRPVPGFEPSPAAFAGSVEQRKLVQAEFAAAVRARQLRSNPDPDEALRLFTVVLSGLTTQQMANQPGATYEHGLFSRLTDQAIEMVLNQYRPPRRR
jgi:hypothetical protein